mmetsp:Transcript_27062/g.65015  ORF Transcript_27062/g.65015 Transcript_27062/m.65015 type:complete len:303 (+) Transcript_27062:1374-2282(+)
MLAHPLALRTPRARFDVGLVAVRVDVLPSYLLPSHVILRRDLFGKRVVIIADLGRGARSGSGVRVSLAPAARTGARMNAVRGRARMDENAVGDRARTNGNGGPAVAILDGGAARQIIGRAAAAADVPALDGLLRPSAIRNQRLDILQDQHLAKGEYAAKLILVLSTIVTLVSLVDVEAAEVIVTYLLTLPPPDGGGQFLDMAVIVDGPHHPEEILPRVRPPRGYLVDGNLQRGLVYRGEGIVRRRSALHDALPRTVLPSSYGGPDERGAQRHDDDREEQAPRATFQGAHSRPVEHASAVVAA